jgi:AbrB family looped-hinge helix DNA binding protein
MKSIVSEKGQVTIPKPLRDSLAIGPGTELDFSEEDGKLVARTVIAQDPFAALVGLIGPTDVDAAIERMRGPRWTKKLDEGDRGNGRR